MAQEQEVKQTSNIEHRTPNAELERAPLEFGVRRSAFGVRRWFRFHVIGRALDFLLGAVFVYAGALKIFEPVGFARDIDNYKMLPWPAAVALGLFLPWLEMFCGLALITRRFYRGALSILTALTTLFVAASVIAKVRGLDISCGCFGHASKGWSFGWHMVLDLALLGALVILLVVENRRSTLNVQPSTTRG